ncbi:hypothetical protein Pfo_018599 [Paulownia fortunei]|nr:hypothetical protein Pfo_018599 [Paulownia fortunei]
MCFCFLNFLVAIAMEVVQVLHMNGGLGETSYANNSLVQRKVISMTKPITEEAITEVYSSMAPKSFCMAELGCSSGPNTLFVATELVKIVGKLSQKHGHQLPEFQILLNDLPGNDFNSIFHSLLPRFQAELLQEMGPGFGPCFVYGVPGSFYGRLFAAKSLHFIHSSYSLMWLSKVPEGLEMNKENIYMASTSPVIVINAYYEQFQRDFSTFLKCRSEEVVGGGRMVLTILGRKSENACSKECCYIWELLALSLKEMEEKLDSYDVHFYAPSKEELEDEVRKEGSFKVELVEMFEMEKDAGNYPSYGMAVAKTVRSIQESMIAHHFGKAILDKLFDHYGRLVDQELAKADIKSITTVLVLTKL